MEENKNILENETVAKVDGAIDGAVDKILGKDDDGKKLSIAALVLGIIGIAGGWIFGAIFALIPALNIIFSLTVFACAILGIVLGVKGRKKSVAATGKSSGLATAGLVLGIIGVSLGALSLICNICTACTICAAGNAANDLANTLADMGM